MTHDQKCTFDPKYCRDCNLQAEARINEREKWAVVFQEKACADTNCGHTACVVYFNAGRILRGLAE